MFYPLLVMRENFRIGSFILILIGIGMFFFETRAIEHRANLEKNGIKTLGKIERGSTIQYMGAHSGTKHYIYVTYEPKDHASITRGFEVSSAFMNTIAKGEKIIVDTVSVVYSASDPEDGFIYGVPFQGGSGTAKFGLLVAGFGLIGFALSFVGTRRPETNPITH
jgi:hypothetical protein